MKKFLPVAFVLLSLTACTHNDIPKPEIRTVTVTNDRFVPVAVDNKYYAKDTCPTWPKKSDYVKNGLSSETSSYLFAGYKAWSCEYTTRMKIAEESNRIAKDIAAQKDVAAPKP